MDSKKFDRISGTVILVGMTVAIIVATTLKIAAEGAGARTGLMVLSGFGAVCGVASTVLAAAGNIWTFLFGLLDVSIYSYVLFDNGMWSQFALHVLYFVPMQFVGYFSWRKKGAGSDSPVRAERMKARDWVFTLGFFTAVFIAMGWLSYFLGKNAGDEILPGKICLDAAITSANITALILMARAFLEQWYLWILVNVCSITIWSLQLSNGYTIVILIKYIFYLLNSLNAVRIWKKLSAPDLEK